MLFAGVMAALAGVMAAPHDNSGHGANATISEPAMLLWASTKANGANELASQGRGAWATHVAMDQIC